MLPFDVVNQHLGDVEVTLRVEIIGGGVYRDVSLEGPSINLKSTQTVKRHLDLETLIEDVDADAFTVSGQILVTTVLTHPDGQLERIVSEPMFFHPKNAGGYAIYDSKARAAEHANGNFRGAHSLPPDPNRMGFVDGGGGLPAEVIEQILIQDPAGAP